jgi:redox-sensitive bicupin YhaK (pirin superfamily)
MKKKPVAAEECSAVGARDLTFRSHPVREVNIGELQVDRVLPIRDRRMVGPWCFLDRFGPLTFTGRKPMDIAPHPHTGIQTVTWLLDGEVQHNDSIGCEAVVRPGGVNVMTAGRGIAHAERTPDGNGGRLHGVQLWIALPDVHRSVDPSFDGIRRVPEVELPGGILRLFAGSMGEDASPARHYSEIIGADVQVHAGRTVELELHPGYEHAVIVLSGDCSIGTRQLGERALHYLGTRRSSIPFGSSKGGRILLIGGTPFPEPILMWWNFVARTREEIALAREDWENHRRFGEVHGYRGQRLCAPDLVRFARPNPMS